MSNKPSGNAETARSTQSSVDTNTARLKPATESKKK